MIQAGLLLAILLSYSGPLLADPADKNLDLICATEILTTSFVILQKDDSVDVELIHHNGAQYAPFWSGLITPNDIATISEKAQAVKDLGDDWHLQFKRSSCKATSETLFSCVGGSEEFQAGGKKIRPWLLHVSLVGEVDVNGSYAHKNVTLGYELDEKSHQITMNYQKNECVQSKDLSQKIKQKLQLKIK